MAKKVLALTLILLAVALSGCTQPAVENQSLQPNQHQEPETRPDLEKLEQAKSQEDPQTCLKISEPAIKDGCLLVLAVKNLSPEICKQISLQTKKDLCYFNVAKNAKESTACESISDTSTKDNCFLNIASENNSEQDCEKITDARIKEACIQANQ